MAAELLADFSGHREVSENFRPLNNFRHALLPATADAARLRWSYLAVLVRKTDGPIPSPNSTCMEWIVIVGLSKKLN